MTELNIYMKDETLLSNFTPGILGSIDNIDSTTIKFNISELKNLLNEIEINTIIENIQSLQVGNNSKITDKTKIKTSISEYFNPYLPKIAVLEEKPEDKIAVLEEKNDVEIKNNKKELLLNGKKILNLNENLGLVNVKYNNGIITMNNVDIDKFIVDKNTKKIIKVIIDELELKIEDENYYIENEDNVSLLFDNSKFKFEEEIGKKNGNITFLIKYDNKYYRFYLNENGEIGIYLEGEPDKLTKYYNNDTNLSSLKNKINEFINKIEKGSDEDDIKYFKKIINSAVLSSFKNLIENYVEKEVNNLTIEESKFTIKYDTPKENSFFNIITKIFEDTDNFVKMDEINISNYNVKENDKEINDALIKNLNESIYKNFLKNSNLPTNLTRNFKSNIEIQSGGEYIQQGGNIVKDSFNNANKFKNWCSTITNNNKTNIIIMGAGPVGLYYAINLLKLYPKQINLLLFENRVQNNHKKKPYIRSFEIKSIFQENIHESSKPHKLPMKERENSLMQKLNNIENDIMNKGGTSTVKRLYLDIKNDDNQKLQLIYAILKNFKPKIMLNTTGGRLKAFENSKIINSKLFDDDTLINEGIEKNKYCIVKNFGDEEIKEKKKEMSYNYEFYKILIKEINGLKFNILNEIGVFNYDSILVVSLDNFKYSETENVNTEITKKINEIKKLNNDEITEKILELLEYKSKNSKNNKDELAKQVELIKQRIVEYTEEEKKLQNNERPFTSAYCISDKMIIQEHKYNNSTNAFIKIDAGTSFLTGHINENKTLIMAGKLFNFLFDINRNTTLNKFINANANFSIKDANIEELKKIQIEITNANKKYDEEMGYNKDRAIITFQNKTDNLRCKITNTIYDLSFYKYLFFLFFKKELIPNYTDVGIDKIIKIVLSNFIYTLSRKNRIDNLFTIILYLVHSPEKLVHSINLIKEAKSFGIGTKNYFNKSVLKIIFELFDKKSREALFIDNLFDISDLSQELSVKRKRLLNDYNIRFDIVFDFFKEIIESFNDKLKNETIKTLDLINDDTFLFNEKFFDLIIESFKFMIVIKNIYTDKSGDINSLIKNYEKNKKLFNENSTSLVNNIKLNHNELGIKYEGIFENYKKKLFENIEKVISVGVDTSGIEVNPGEKGYYDLLEEKEKEVKDFRGKIKKTKKYEFKEFKTLVQIYKNIYKTETGNIINSTENKIEFNPMEYIKDGKKNEINFPVYSLKINLYDLKDASYLSNIYNISTKVKRKEIKYINFKKIQNHSEKLSPLEEDKFYTDDIKYLNTYKYDFLPDVCEMYSEHNIYVYTDINDLFNKKYNYNYKFDRNTKTYIEPKKQINFFDIDNNTKKINEIFMFDLDSKYDKFVPGKSIYFIIKNENDKKKLISKIFNIFNDKDNYKIKEDSLTQLLSNNNNNFKIITYDNSQEEHDINEFLSKDNTVFQENLNIKSLKSNEFGMKDTNDYLIYCDNIVYRTKIPILLYGINLNKYSGLFGYGNLYNITEKTVKGKNTTKNNHFLLKKYFCNKKIGYDIAIIKQTYREQNKRINIYLKFQSKEKLIIDGLKYGENNNKYNFDFKSRKKKINSENITHDIFLNNFSYAITYELYLNKKNFKNLKNQKLTTNTESLEFTNLIKNSKGGGLNNNQKKSKKKLQRNTTNTQTKLSKKK